MKEKYDFISRIRYLDVKDYNYKSQTSYILFSDNDDEILNVISSDLTSKFLKLFGLKPANSKDIYNRTDIERVIFVKKEGNIYEAKIIMQEKGEYKECCANITISPSEKILDQTKMEEYLRRGAAAKFNHTIIYKNVEGDIEEEVKSYALQDIPEEIEVKIEAKGKSESISLKFDPKERGTADLPLMSEILAIQNTAKYIEELKNKGKIDRARLLSEVKNQELKRLENLRIEQEGQIARLHGQISILNKEAEKNGQIITQQKIEIEEIKQIAENSKRQEDTLKARESELSKENEQLKLHITELQVENENEKDQKLIRQNEQLKTTNKSDVIDITSDKVDNSSQTLNEYENTGRSEIYVFLEDGKIITDVSMELIQFWLMDKSKKIPSNIEKVKCEIVKNRENIYEVKFSIEGVDYSREISDITYIAASQQVCFSVCGNNIGRKSDIELRGKLGAEMFSIKKAIEYYEKTQKIENKKDISSTEIGNSSGGFRDVYDERRKFLYLIDGKIRIDLNIDLIKLLLKDESKGIANNIEKVKCEIIKTGENLYKISFSINGVNYSREISDIKYIWQKDTMPRYNNSTNINFIIIEDEKLKLIETESLIVSYPIPENLQSFSFSLYDNNIGSKFDIKLSDKLAVEIFSVKKAIEYYEEYEQHKSKIINPQEKQKSAEKKDVISNSSVKSDDSVGKSNETKSGILNKIWNKIKEYYNKFVNLAWPTKIISGILGASVIGFTGISLSGKKEAAKNIILKPYRYLANKVKSGFNR